MSGETGLIFVIGIMAGVVAIVLVMKAINKDGKSRTQYDERQLAVRGKAYMYGFYTALIACVVLLIMNGLEVGTEALGKTGYFIPIFAGTVAQVTYSIFHDAYEGLNTNMSRLIVVMAMIGGLNFAVSIINLVRGELYKGGELQLSFLNLLCGLLFVVIAVEMLVKRAMDKREGGE